MRRLRRLSASVFARVGTGALSSRFAGPPDRAVRGPSSSSLTGRLAVTVEGFIGTVAGVTTPAGTLGASFLAASSALRRPSSSIRCRASSSALRRAAASRSLLSRSLSSLRRRASSSWRLRSSASRRRASDKARSRASFSSAVSVRRTTPERPALPDGACGRCCGAGCGAPCATFGCG